MTAWAPQPTARLVPFGTPGAVPIHVAVKAHPWAFGPGPFVNRGDLPVVIDPPDFPEHDYKASMIWPAGADRDLCMVCRGTHT